MKERDRSPRNRNARCPQSTNEQLEKVMSSEKKALDVIEKRRFLRLSDNFRIEFERTDEYGAEPDENSAGVGFSKDLSMGGVAFVTPNPSAINVGIGDVLRAEITIPELDNPVTVVGEVVRCVETEDSNIEVALRFLPFGLNEEQRVQLELFIYEQFLDEPF